MRGMTGVKGTDVPTANSLRALRLLLELYATAELPQWDYFSSHVRSIFIPAGQPLITVEEKHPHVHFVKTGILKAQCLVGGRLTTLFFLEEGNIIGSVAALGSEGMRRVADRGLLPQSEVSWFSVEKAPYTVTAIESSLVMRVSFAVIEQLAATSTVWSHLVANVSTMHVAALLDELMGSRAAPEERYRHLLTTNPALVGRVTQRDLAGYLNVTEASLSRLIKRVRSEPSPRAVITDSSRDHRADSVG